MSQEGSSPDDLSSEYEIGDVLDQLEELEESVSSPSEQRDVRTVKRMLEGVPGSERIKKYTTRDVAEGFVGGIIFSLPLLVEDGVFEIAEWFVSTAVGPVPVFLLVNILCTVLLVAGLLHYTDIRQVKPRLLFGVLPKRLTGILLISFAVALGSMFLWGRLHAEDPTRLEAFARVAVIWTAAAVGATLGDILPGESRREDLIERRS